MQQQAICHLSVVPMRAEPSDKSEQINQVLFGDTMTVLEYGDKWLRVQLHHDEYEGWIDSKQALLQKADQTMHAKSLLATDLLNRASNARSESVFIPLGSFLPMLPSPEFQLAGNTYSYWGKGVAPSTLSVTDVAQRLLNAPYQWGGRSVLGLDCSGFTQIVYRFANVSLKRDAWQQAEQGALVNFIDEALPGDLVFFDNEEGRIIHVGIVLEGNRIIHASGCVRIDKLDHNGIYNVDTRKYSHNLRIIKRVIG